MPERNKPRNQCKDCGKYYNRKDVKCHWCGTWKGIETLNINREKLDGLD